MTVKILDDKVANAAEMSQALMKLAHIKSDNGETAYGVVDLFKEEGWKLANDSKPLTRVVIAADIVKDEKQHAGPSSIPKLGYTEIDKIGSISVSQNNTINVVSQVPGSINFNMAGGVVTADQKLIEFILKENKEAIADLNATFQKVMFDIMATVKWLKDNKHEIAIDNANRQIIEKVHE